MLPRHLTIRRLHCQVHGRRDPGYFGYPRAHEDDAERAITAGLSLVAAVRQLDTKATDLSVRVGIATGPVVVGDLIGQGTSQEAAVTSETPNLAARLQALAAPNAVVIAETTYRLAGAMFECTNLGRQSFKGFAEPVRSWSVIGRGGSRAASSHAIIDDHQADRARRDWRFCSAAGSVPRRVRDSWCYSPARPASASRGWCARCRRIWPGAAHTHSLPVLALPHEQRTVSVMSRSSPPRHLHQPTRDSEARQAGGAARVSGRGTADGGVDRIAAVRSDRRALSGTRLEPSATQGADACCAG